MDSTALQLTPYCFFWHEGRHFVAAINASGLIKEVAESDVFWGRRNEQIRGRIELRNSGSKVAQVWNEVNTILW
jgi:hypothetical protein